MRIDAFFVCKQELGARRLGVPEGLLCSSAQGRSKSLCLITPGTLTPGRWTSVSCVVGFEVQPARTPRPSSVITDFSHPMAAVQWKNRSSSQHSARIDCLHHRDICHIHRRPTCQNFSYIEMSQPPKEGKYSYTINTPKTSPNILANVIILSYIF